MAVASVTKITAASSEGFDAAVREGLARASRTLRGITGLHVLEHKASVENGKIDEYRVTMEVTFILEIRQTDRTRGIRLSGDRSGRNDGGRTGNSSCSDSHVPT
jgi:dodecin